ncbi:MAG TPA: cytochrome c3 family protein [Steroidobacteraceae bacterium]|nr:cytochrome c3 family protein [Steroidobacteraceae bacterium]
MASKVFLLLAAAALPGGMLLWWRWPKTDYARNRREAVAQPVPFSHQHHVAGLGIDCRFCHASVEVSSNAGLPPTYTCMTCHSQIWTKAALLAPVRESLITGIPIVWRRVTDLPDYVYFNHSIHIAKGVGCESCHGEVATMALTYKAKALTMKFCLDCHRNPGPRLRPKSAIFDTKWHRTADTPSPATLLGIYHVPDRNLTDCSLCHR